MDSISVPTGTVIPYSVSAAQGFTYPVAVIEDSIIPAAGIITMTAAHDLQGAALASPPRTGTAAQYADSLRAVVRSATPAESYRKFVMWAMSEAQNSSLADFDSLMRVADFLAFDPMSDDSLDMVRFDRAMSGYVFEFDSDTVAAYGPPYSSTIAGRRRRPAPHVASTDQAAGIWPKPRVLYINGIRNEYQDAAHAAILLKAMIHGVYGDSVITSFIYNPTFSVQWPDWDQKHKCAYATLRAAAVGVLPHINTDALAIAVKYAACRGFRLLNEAAQTDLGEAFLQVLDLTSLGAAPIREPLFVGQLADAAQWFHDRNIATIFVAHSQGNLMLAQALAKPQFDRLVTPSARICTAAVSLAPPRDPTDFTQYSWLPWSGFILNHDVLTLFLMNTNVDHVHGTISDEFDNRFLSIGGYKPSVAYAWGSRIHKIDNYLIDKALESGPRIATMVNGCLQVPIQ